MFSWRKKYCCQIFIPNAKCISRFFQIHSCHSKKLFIQLVFKYAKQVFLFVLNRINWPFQQSIINDIIGHSNVFCCCFFFNLNFICNVTICFSHFFLNQMTFCLNYLSLLYFSTKTTSQQNIDQHQIFIFDYCE